jgi:hypothetical protein
MTREKLLDEYDHRCAVCGSERPHIHHIDEDPSHNDLQNLLPLCPNCHLRDQHNPTKKLEIPKLKLFRKHKDPAMLKAQFHPLYVRQIFLEHVDEGDDSVRELEARAGELVEFVGALDMGGFYAKQIGKLISPPTRVIVRSLGGGHDPEYERQRRSANREYREKLRSNRDAVQTLLVELLRYQSWSDA